ncbi:leader peptidase (prepilin peptidase) / N-methyltransferase [Caloramator quimbayensis]|uniref:Leader peptidase (Prepilin peptidase) / N-methyltransferase n=1 Tax=Caloramator quimbayensis TaxID=1147123 RepID=A0A1T4WWU8_9CLOT|nr:A24 family peptidase [Caloramator quimbayensis]SKA81820.1 leader peptidase (prepilin peptidase) / N-methyltransferase [Caloramator quimbayensis]
MNTILVIIYGIVIGSFLNVCIYRIPNNESISYPPSHCTNCGNRIKWYDLIPVLSYAALKGRCRFCNTKISAEYPLIEIFTALVFANLYHKYGITFEFFKYAVFVAILIVIGMIDLKTTDVYFSTIVSGLITGALFASYELYRYGVILNYFLGAAFAAGIIAVIILLTKGMGWGDAEICLVCGLYLGFKLSIVMLFLTFIIGAIAGIVLILTKIKSRKDFIPFGPFISLASIITVFWGENIIAWYFKSLML